MASNTWPLEHFYNWSGLCIEPNPKYFDGILSNRKCTLLANPIYSSTNSIVKFNFLDGFSGIVEDGLDNANRHDEVVSLETITLSKALHRFNAPNIINYLSLDVEGAEYHVLKNFPFDKYTFQVMTIERPIDLLHYHLAKHGYWWVELLSDFGEMIYIHHSIQNFSQIMDEARASKSSSCAYRSESKSHICSFVYHPKWPADNV